ncbi:MAG: cytochrome c4 [Gammaproteobacteria bacterium]|nr:cytochrome c4 [Gammaproteobacteria bacterium]
MNIGALKPGLALLALFLVSLHGTVFAGDPEAGKAKSAVCAACHGMDGKALLPEYPNLAAQGEKYMIKQLQEFKSGARENALMMPMAANLSDEDMADISAYYASLPAIQGVASEDNLAAGRDIYRGGITSAGIAACIGCHGPNGQGNPMAGFPMLSGQNSSYVYTTLQQFRAGTRANDANEVMRGIAHRITNEEIAAVANYVQGLK